MNFPDDFLFATATASYQVEGAVDADGRKPSIWDTFSHTPGKIAKDDNGDTACDSYHRYMDDVAVLKEIGVGAYRFSIAWPRIFPDGRGSLNQAGLDYYHRLVDALLDAGIQPWPTFYHWDLPQALEDEGGWRVRSTVDAFEAYAATVVKSLGDKVHNWYTLNEIMCFAGGYFHGGHAPGAKEGEAVHNQVRHHALLAHGRAIRVVREHGVNGARVGMAHNPPTVMPLIETEENIAAAKEEWKNINAWYFEPLFNKQYPEYRVEKEGPLPEIEAGDMDCIAERADFMGLNLYSGGFIRAGKDGPAYYDHGKDYPRTLMTWPITPQIVYWQTRFINETYGPIDLYISENGMALHDTVNDEGRCEDPARVQYLSEHMRSAGRAISEGIPLKGYFVWTLLDNFEWALGYEPRFGLVHIDYETFKRTPKTSAYWYQNLIRTRHLP